MKSMLLRFALAVCLCAALVISSISGAIAAPVKGEATHPAKEYEQAAKDAIDEGGPNSLEGIMKRQQEGSPN